MPDITCNYCLGKFQDIRAHIDETHLRIIPCDKSCGRGKNMFRSIANRKQHEDAVHQTTSVSEKQEPILIF